MSVIKSLRAREIIDSRGYPTVEVEVEVAKNIFARSSVPSGSSTGSFESHELRDNDKKRFFSKGVLKAVDFVNTEIRQTLLGYDSSDQKNIDKTLIDLDGTKNKSRIGSNSILAVSLACAKASAKFYNIPLHKYIGGLSFSLPTPMMNIVNGGCHSSNSLDFQEFMIVPMGFKKFKESLRAGCEIFQMLKKNLLEKNMSVSVGDEGGFSPNFRSNNECLDIILKSVNDAKYKPGENIFFALDVASSEFYKKPKYNLKGEGLLLDSDGLIKYYENLLNNYPIISIEDGLDENDWDGWKNMTKILGNRCQLVGDDLFVTSVNRLKKGIKENSGNSILIKLNQIGTLSETIDAVEMAKKNHFNTIISHRSGETEDTFIADFSVGVSAGQIKTGSLSRTERVSKYNQLLRIEEKFSEIKFSSISPFKAFL